MSTQTFLITGATGDTGGYTARLLLSKGHQVRALVHRRDVRSQRLQELGAEVVLGDLDNFDAVRKALIGVDGAYFVYPIQKGIVQASAQFAQAAKEAGVNNIVNMSQFTARNDAESRASTQHWLAERVFDWSGVSVAHIRPTFFAEWLLYLAPSIREGKLTALFGTTGRHAPITAEDQASVIVAILLNPLPHRNKIYPLSGPVEFTMPETAALLSRVLGKTIEYQQITKEQFEAYRKANTADPSQPRTAQSSYFESEERAAYLLQHLVEAAVDHHNGLNAGTNSLVEEISGKKQSSMQLQEFIEKNRAAFV